MLIVDDTTLDKFYARQMALVMCHWSGKQGQVVQGINLISLLGTDGEARLPCDFCLYNKEQDNMTKKTTFVRCCIEPNLVDSPLGSFRQLVFLTEEPESIVFISKDGNVEYWATSRLDMSLDTFYASVMWQIPTYLYY
ncbi:hypothetical protein M1N22_03590 [Dehalococcoidia bacterium]|nr:hypothetical protein [Dehalococcoidia bacterium]